MKSSLFLIGLSIATISPACAIEGAESDAERCRLTEFLDHLSADKVLSNEPKLVRVIKAGDTQLVCQYTTYPRDCMFSGSRKFAAYASKHEVSKQIKDNYRAISQLLDSITGKKFTYKVTNSRNERFTDIRYHDGEIFSGRFVLKGADGNLLETDFHSLGENCQVADWDDDYFASTIEHDEKIFKSRENKNR